VQNTNPTVARNADDFYSEVFKATT
jgi:hypothetical protein